MKVIRSGTKEFDVCMDALLHRRHRVIDELSPEVEKQIAAFRKNGEKYLIESAQQFDHVELSEKSLYVDPDKIKNSHKFLSPSTRQSIEHALERIERFQQELKLSSFQVEEEAGVFWGSEVRPLDRVGIYVPGGKANYFVTLLLCGVPARQSGVKELVVATPPRKKLGPPYLEPTLLYAAKLLEVSQIFISGGVPAMAAMAFGTPHMKPVQKIVGSGGRRTVVAKLKLSGYVGTDGLTGPSETAFICNKTSSVKNVAADILGRTERDPDAIVFVFHSDDAWMQDLTHELAQSIGKIKDQESRQSIQQSLEHNFYCFLVRNMDEAIQYTNQIAPGVVCITVKNASDYVEQVKACGSVLLGHFTPSTALDLVGGPSGLVNTMGAAAFTLTMSPALFCRRFSVVEFNREALERFEKESLNIAEEEGFFTHEASYKSRLE